MVAYFTTIIYVKKYTVGIQYNKNQYSCNQPVHIFKG